MKHFLLFLSALLFSTFLFSQPVMVTDIIEGSEDSFSNWPERFRAYDGKLIFSVDDQIHGTELWISDGTAEGTYMLKDINPSGDSDPHSFFEYDGKLFFGATDEEGNLDLWTSDGTESGTSKFFATPSNSRIGSFAVMNGLLYFSQSGTLYKTDGTEAGTSAFTNVLAPSQFVVCNDMLFFHASNSSSIGLWRSDGTAEGTMFLKDISPDSWSSWYRYPVAFKDKFYFTGGETYDNKMWVSDGTSEGTYVFLDVDKPKYYTVLGDVMVFAAEGDLWRTDGTVDGTYMIEDFDIFGYQGFPNNFTVMDGYVYFPVTHGDFTSGYGREMFKTTGELGSTVIVKDIREGFLDSNPENFKKINHEIFFTAVTSEEGQELWVTDGTADGTHLVMDIFAGNSASSPRRLTNVSGNLFFVADDGIHGKELWFYDIVTSIPEISKKEDFVTAFPNPAVDKISIQVTDNTNDRLEYILTDNLGKTILSGEINDKNVDIKINGMENGLYFLKVFSKKKSQVLPVCILK